MCPHMLFGHTGASTGYWTANDNRVHSSPIGREAPVTARASEQSWTVFAADVLICKKGVPSVSALSKLHRKGSISGDS